MRVKVIPLIGMRTKALDDYGWMEMPEGALLSDVIKALGVPALVARFFQLHLNGLKQPLDTALKDGDVVSFFAIVSGG